MSRGAPVVRLLELAAASEADALTRGAALARLRLAQQASERADLCERLAAGVRSGRVDPTSAQAEGLEQMAAVLRLLGCAESAALARESQAGPASLWGRLRWLLLGR